MCENRFMGTSVVEVSHFSHGRIAYIGATITRYRRLIAPTTGKPKAMSCDSPWLQSLKSWSLRQTGGGSFSMASPGWVVRSTFTKSSTRMTQRSRQGRQLCHRPRVWRATTSS
jgi:hypothetical protein